MDKAELLSYVRARRLAVIGTIGPDGSPQGALVGVAVTDRFQIIFDTVSDSRKHQNLLRDTRIAATLSGPGEQTLQVEGRAYPVSAAAVSDALYRQAYLALGRRHPISISGPSSATGISKAIPWNESGFPRSLMIHQPRPGPASIDMRWLRIARYSSASKWSRNCGVM